MSEKIIGITVGTPTSIKRVEQDLKPVKTVNGVPPDENGNVVVSGGSGGTSESGATFIPVINDSGTLSWTNDKGLSNPAPVNLVDKVVAALPVYNGEVGNA